MSIDLMFVGKNVQGDKRRQTDSTIVSYWAAPGRCFLFKVFFSSFLSVEWSATYVLYEIYVPYYYCPRNLNYSYVHTYCNMYKPQPITSDREPTYSVCKGRELVPS